jgi:antitoxin (DNA-binding transcriptional repressor) of toxin-antitoxin stability system
MARGGERVLVTDHDRVVAEIVPRSEGGDSKSLLDEYIESQVKNGTVVPATRRATLSRERSSSDFGSAEESRRIYEETRTDRS